MTRILLCGESTYLGTGFAVYCREVMARLHATGRFELAELGCYGPIGDPREASIPWRYYANMPVNDQERGQYEARPTNQFGEWKFEEVCCHFRPDVVFDVRDWWMCLSSGTPIVCINGIKPVEQLQNGDLVLTHNGRFRAVTHVFPPRVHNGLFVTLTPSHFRLPVRLTEKHPVLVIPRNGNVNLPKFDEVEPAWKDSDTVAKGDIVCLPRTPHGSGDLEPDFARLLGYYAAEGCVMYEGRKELGKLKGVQFTIHEDEWPIAADIGQLIEKYFGKQASYKHCWYNRTRIVRVVSAKAAAAMLRYVPGLARTKTLVPELLLSGTEAATRQFLCGLFRGDGHLSTKKKRATYSTSSLELAMQVFQLCVRHGILPSMSHQVNKLRGKAFRRYLFNFGGNAYDGFVALWNGGNEPISSSKRIDARFAYLTVDEVRHEQTSEPVFNFEVAQDNSYVSSFALHNCEHEGRSPFRPYFHWSLMPTVDAQPQDEQWMASYMQADSVLAYSDWGLDLLKQQGGGLVKALGSAPPGADFHSFRPMSADDRLTLRKNCGLRTDALIIGTVMRNQKRKLYPDLCKAFGRFLREAPTEIASRAYLYLHTSYPDVGWDLPRFILENGIGHRTLVTYHCQHCNAIYPSHFMDSRGVCKTCGAPMAVIPNSLRPVPNQALGLLLNLMDVYVQYAICEGFGMPQVEAGACGVPVMAVDYSAMSDVVRKLGGIPIKVQRLYREAETHCYRALPCEDDFLAQLTELLQDDNRRQDMGLVARQAVETHYSYDKTAKRWFDLFSAIQLVPHERTWLAPPRLHQPRLEAPAGLTNENFVRWALICVAGRPDLVNSYTALRLTRDLNNEVSNDIGTGGFYINEASYLGQQNRFRPFGRNEVVQECLKICEFRNHWERRRHEMVCTTSR